MIAAAMIGTLAIGCVDLTDFDGAWRGQIVADPAIRQGFAADTVIEPLTLANVSLDTLSAHISSSDGRFDETRLIRVRKSAADALGSLTFDSRPLQSFLLFAPLEDDPQGAPAYAVLSLFSDDRVELRVLRGNDVYGVFRLERVR